MSDGYAAADFDRAVALVSSEPSPRVLAERLGVDWDYLTRLALDASATVLGERAEARGAVVFYGSEAFAGGFLIGAHVGGGTREPCVSETQSLLTHAVDAVQGRGRHAVIADHCDLTSVAALETLYCGALVESMPLAEPERADLLTPVTRIFEAGLAVGLALGTEGDPADTD